MSTIAADSTTTRSVPLFTASDRSSIAEAIRAEVAASSGGRKTSWLDIDAIEHLADQPGHFVYRLVLSTPVRMDPDQAITFQTQRPKDTIPAVVLKVDDEGMIVECQKALPADAKLLSVSLDPTIILRALGEFIEQVSAEPGPLARLVYAKALLPRPQVVGPPIAGLNEKQSSAIAEMSETPLVLLRYEAVRGGEPVQRRGGGDRIVGISKCVQGLSRGYARGR